MSVPMFLVPKLSIEIALQITNYLTLYQSHGRKKDKPCFKSKLIFQLTAKAHIFAHTNVNTGSLLPVLNNKNKKSKQVPSVTNLTLVRKIDFHYTIKTLPTLLPTVNKAEISTNKF